MASIAIEHVEARDVETGFPVFIQQAHLELLRERGELVIRLRLPNEAPPVEWLTKKAAAVEYMGDVDGVDFERARRRIDRAAKAGKFKSAGNRIEPDSFRAWRLKQREANLDKRDE